MKIWIHKTDRRWWKYWKPVWLNRISWNEGDPKIYRFLWWGYTFVSHNTEKHSGNYKNVSL
jgi:hypothetical protein